MVFCQISLENNIENELIAGQTVSGIIDIQLRQKLDVKRLFLIILGYGRCEWGSGKSRVRGAETLFNSNIQLIPNRMELPCGNHRYDFRFTIPKSTPSTIFEEHGSIKYKIVVYFVRPWKRNLKFSLPFKVLHEIDLNVHPELRNQLTLNNNEMIVSIPRTGFVVFEEIPVHVIIKNLRATEIRCSLNKFVSHAFVDQCSCSSNKEFKVKIHTITKPCTNGQSDYTIMFKIPKVTTSTHDAVTDIVTVKYVLSVKAKSGFMSETKVVFPIVIATTGISNVNETLGFGYGGPSMSQQQNYPYSSPRKTDDGSGILFDV